jgi:hypothetical protein
VKSHLSEHCLRFGIAGIILYVGRSTTFTKLPPLLVVVNMADCTGNIVVAGRTKTITTTHFLWFLPVIYINFMHNLSFAKIT